MPSARDIKALFKNKPVGTGRRRMPGRTYAERAHLTALLAHQHDLCAACTDPLKGSYSIDVDKQGAIKGLLCHGCKQAVTWVSRSQRRAAGVLKYLADGLPGLESLPIARVRIQRRPGARPVVSILDADGTRADPGAGPLADPSICDPSI